MVATEALIAQLRAHSDAANAVPMKAYMKHLFPFLGIKSPSRKAILRSVINAHKEEFKDHTETITEHLYKQDEREFHYCAMEVYARFKKKNYKASDIEFITYLITTHSHWDTVDYIAKHILGQFLLEQPQLRDSVIQAYATDENMWLNRSAILFQLGYKDKTDFKLLTQLCKAHKHSNEFFIKKAIGWALREYAKVNMPDVVAFVHSTDLKPLSRKEALKHYK